MRILVIDDEALIRRSLVRALSSHVVDSVSSCSEARERLTGASYDLVLCDLHLPDGVGTEILAWIGSTGADVGCFALISGSAPQPGDPDSIEDMGCPVLAKPFGTKAVLELLATVEGAGPRQSTPVGA